MVGRKLEPRCDHILAVVVQFASDAGMVGLRV